MYAKQPLDLGKEARARGLLQRWLDSTTVKGARLSETDQAATARHACHAASRLCHTSQSASQVTNKRTPFLRRQTSCETR